MAQGGKKWKKGQSGNPKGRPPILSPELQREISQNKTALKQLVLQYLNLTQYQIQMRQADPNIPMVEAMLGQAIEKAHVHGDIGMFKAICEIPLGLLVHEGDDLELSEDERNLILEYRRQLSDEQSKSLAPRSTDLKPKA